jgi:hypothetical protein
LWRDGFSFRFGSFFAGLFDPNRRSQAHSFSMEYGGALLEICAINHLRDFSMERTPVGKEGVHSRFSREHGLECILHAKTVLAGRGFWFASLLGVVLA